MLFNKPLTEIDENDLHVLIDDKVAERKTIEYKRELPGNSYKDRKEFLADVSSFANTVGGYLIYGIDAKDGVPVKICGVEIASVDAFKLTCENRLRDGLSPQIPPFDIQPIELTTNNYVIILRIPRSWLSPHRVTLENHGHFYGRNSVGHFQMDVPQLRTAFELAGTMGERIRSYRAERLSRISSGEEIPAPFDEQAAKLVLHIIPLNAFTNSVTLDLRPLNDAMNGHLWKPLLTWDLEPNVDVRFNMDGIVRLNNRVNPPSTVAYTQVFRNGIIETVDISLLGVYRWGTGIKENIAETKRLNGEVYERKLLETVKRFIKVQQLLGVEPPFFIMVSLLGVKGYRIVHPRFENSFTQFTEAIDKANLVIPEIMIENFDTDLAEAMKPIFDTIWNAAGREGSLNYDESGKFTFDY